MESFKISAFSQDEVTWIRFIAPPPTLHTHTHTHTCARTHTCTHMHARTHMHPKTIQEWQNVQKNDFHDVKRKKKIPKTFFGGKSRWIVQFIHVYSLERVCKHTGKGNPGKAHPTNRVEKPEVRSGETKGTGDCRTEYWKDKIAGENCGDIQRVPQGITSILTS